ncbi:MAG: hypothetical protein EOP04_28010, partial [Proteobacteria bacterium]
MKLPGTIFFLAVTVGTFAEAMTGAISGGGGKGVVCRNADGAITSARTLDLYEGEVLYNLRYNAGVKLTVEYQIQKALAVIPTSSRAMVES